MSCARRCVDIGETVSAALSHFETTGNSESGSTDESSSGNGALMRLAPAILSSFSDPETAIDHAVRSTITTHGSELCHQSSACFAAILADALVTGDTGISPLKPDDRGVWRGLQLRSEIQAVIDGRYRQLEPPTIQGSDFVVKTLKAALWAYATSDDFEQGALKAANLGDDADTTAAIFGQLAGASYGAAGIPDHWKQRLAWYQPVTDLADALAMRLTRSDIVALIEFLGADDGVTPEN